MHDDSINVPAEPMPEQPDSEDPQKIEQVDKFVQGLKQGVEGTIEALATLFKTVEKPCLRTILIKINDETSV